MQGGMSGIAVKNQLSDWVRRSVLFRLMRRIWSFGGSRGGFRLPRRVWKMGTWDWGDGTHERWRYCGGSRRICECLGLGGIVGVEGGYIMRVVLPGTQSVWYPSVWYKYIRLFVLFFKSGLLQSTCTGSKIYRLPSTLLLLKVGFVKGILRKV